jgi:acetyl esterase/lipase
MSIHPAEGIRNGPKPNFPVPEDIGQTSIHIPGVEEPLRCLVLRPKGRDDEALPLIIAYHGGGALANTPE